MSVAHTAETYREAAWERIRIARDLHDMQHDYGAAHYWAGLAVECMLRAYRARSDTRFDSRHDLARWFMVSGLRDALPAALVPAVAAAVQEVATRWSNDHRYRPGRLIERWLRDAGVDCQVSGDRLKYSSSRILDAAEYVVQMGERRWRS